jgi:hypothetical protein
VVRNSKLASLAIIGLYNNPPLRSVVTGNTIQGPGGVLVKISPDGDGQVTCARSDHRFENNLVESTSTSSATDVALLYLRCGTHNIIAGNTLRSRGRSRGIYMRDQFDDNLIEDNDVWINVGDRAALHFSSGNVDKHHPRNNLIRHNVFRADAARSIYIQSHDFRNNTFADNLFWGNASEGGWISGGTGNVFDHNTFVNSEKGVALMLERLEAPGNTYTSNIFSTAGKGIHGFSGSTDLEGYHGDYNLFFWDTQNMDNALAYWRWMTGDEQHSIAADPMFADPAAGDFRLQVGSPALTGGPAGTPIGAYGLVSD